MYKKCINKIHVRNISTTIIINDSYSESSYLLEEIRFLLFLKFRRIYILLHWVAI